MCKLWWLLKSRFCISNIHSFDLYLLLLLTSSSSLSSSLLSPSSSSSSSSSLLSYSFLMLSLFSNVLTVSCDNVYGPNCKDVRWLDIKDWKVVGSILIVSHLHLPLYRNEYLVEWKYVCDCHRATVFQCHRVVFFSRRKIKRNNGEFLYQICDMQAVTL